MQGKEGVKESKENGREKDELRVYIFFLAGTSLHS